MPKHGTKRKLKQWVNTSDQARRIGSSKQGGKMMERVSGLR